MFALLTLSAALADSPVILNEETITTLPAPPLAAIPLEDGAALVLTARRQLQRWEQGADGAWVMVWERSEPDAAGLFVAGGQAWVERHQIRAEPLAAAPLSAMPSAAARQPVGPTSTASASLGTVLRLDSGDGVIDLGRADGLSVGDEVRFLRIEEEPSFSGEGSHSVERVVGSGRVRALEEQQALVSLSRGSRIQVDDRAERRDGSAGYPAAPSRLGGLGEVGVILRPLLALDTLGVAFINEGWVHWTFERPWYLEARLSPAGLGWSQDGNPLSFAAVAAGGFDNRWFSVGLGAGWSMLNRDVSVYGYATEDSSGGRGDSLDFEDVTGAFAVAQQARLGAQDGLHLTVRNTFVLAPEYEYTWSETCDEETYSGDYSDCESREQVGKAFAFGGIAMRLSAPTGDRADLFMDWGTGEAGAVWVTGGVGAWIRGNGDAGSVGVEAAAGYGQLTGDPDDTYVSLYGPLVSAGARLRL